MVLYLFSEEYLEILDCFLDFFNIGEFLRRIIYLIIDFFDMGYKV